LGFKEEELKSTSSVKQIQLCNDVACVHGVWCREKIKIIPVDVITGLIFACLESASMHSSLVM